MFFFNILCVHIYESFLAAHVCVFTQSSLCIMPITYPSFFCRCTTSKLASILNAALVRHIHSSLPDLKQTVSDEIYRVERQLDALGDPVKTHSRELIVE